METWQSTHEILLSITSVLDFISVVIISIGAIYSISRFFWGYLGKAPGITIDMMRLELGRCVILAVEFLLASDIIKTIITPDYYQIGMLGALVVIRTVLTYFLNMELSSLSKEERAQLKAK